MNYQPEWDCGANWSFGGRYKIQPEPLLTFQAAPQALPRLGRALGLVGAGLCAGRALGGNLDFLGVGGKPRIEQRFWG